MNRLLDHPFLAGVGLAVFHALWEVTLLGLLAWAGLFLLRRRSARARYAFACWSLGAMVAAPVLTFLASGRPGAGEVAFDAALLVIQEGRGGATWLSVLHDLAPWLALAWALGAALMGLRLGGGLWWLERRYVAPSRPVPLFWQETAQRLATRMGVSRRIRIHLSRAADSPLVIGWLRPVILVPASAFLHLTPEALEAVLAHEIAHVRRSDYFANLLQSVAEAILFFHPAAWWLSRHVRELREHCCDDVAAALCGDPMALAEGLSTLERLRRTLQSSTDPAPELALGAAKGNLMLRIDRLFRSQSVTIPSFRGLAFMLAAASLLGAATLATQGKPAPKPAAVVETEFSAIKIRHQPPAPAYPASAKAARIQGVVIVSITVDEKGLPEKVEAVEGPEELRATAVDYAKAWKFQPFKVKGMATKACFKLTMPFKLRD
jgi:TonB family protein